MTALRTFAPNDVSINGALYTDILIARKFRNFLWCADNHLTGSKPVARLDPDWLGTQRLALRFLVDTANVNEVPLLIGGDLIDHARIATDVVVMAIQELQKTNHGTYLIAGNHCCENHSTSNIDKGSIGVFLSIFPKIPSIPGIQSANHFGEDVDDGSPVLFTHQLIFKDEASRPPMAKGITAADLLAKFPSAKWIFTGDHHSAWTYTESGRTVVNPGCMISHTASDIGHNGKCALIDLDSETPVTWISIPDDPAMLTRDHLDAKVYKDDRLSGFMERVKGAGETKLTFKDKLEARMGLQDITDDQTQAFEAIKTKATEEEK